jgi:hypothetical protein
VVVPLNLQIHLTGDDLCRRPIELHDSSQNALAPGRIQYCLDWAKRTERVVFISGCDEVNAIWGPTPIPYRRKVGR